jgi:hypothetical protein
MDFIVTDREGIEEGVSVKSAYIVISISDPGSRRPKSRSSRVCEVSCI